MAQSAYLSIDIGTTHSKVALFGEDGVLLRLALTSTITNRNGEQVTYDPERIWNDIAALIRSMSSIDENATIRGIGITSMAESGLLIGRKSGKPLSPFIPWFSTVTMPQMEQIAANCDTVERFIATGLKPSYKFGLAKLLWIRENIPEAFQGEEPVWLSASDYIAYRLTGEFATDYTLAARTYGYRIDRKAWDAEWLSAFGFSASLFPEVHPAGSPIGRVKAEHAQALGLTDGIPVVIGGHDHVVAALAAGVVKPEAVMDSMGTAETLVGMFQKRPLTQADYESGFSYGMHVIPGSMFWMGGVPASGGSVEWFRTLMADTSLSYEQMAELLATIAQTPTGLIYLPNMTGSGSLIGLSSAHGKGHIIKAVLEGTAYEMQSVREKAEHLLSTSLDSVRVVGGGTKNKAWLQIKADVSGTELLIPDQHESALLGAAILAAAGAGAFDTIVQARSAMCADEQSEAIAPNHLNHDSYKQLYIEKYKPLQSAIRKLIT